MAEIVTGTVTGIVDTSGITRDIADVRRETALESGDVRRDIAADGRHTSDIINAASSAAARDASAFYIADVATQNQFATASARSQAWTEAKVDAGFIKVDSDTALASQIVQGQIALQAEVTRGAMALQHGVLTLQVAEQAAMTRSMLQANEIANLRSKSEERYTKLVELEGDRKHCDRDYQRLDRSMQQNQWASLQSQLQAFNSDLQSTRQGVINLGTMGNNTPTATTTAIR